MTLLNQQMSLEAVALKVSDLTKSVAFYQQVLGLQVKSLTTTEAVLGTKNRNLLILKQPATIKVTKTPRTGLYHFALLVSSEEVLGSFLHHLLKNQYSIDGAGDHIYSQAIYLHDLDGNGIEVYADRPQSQWIIHDDGTIEAATNAVDVRRLLSLANDQSWQGMPEDTVMGHVHLQVRDIEAARQFEVDFLGMDVKTDMGSALFTSVNGYHHHLGNNIWSGTHLKSLAPDETGLLYYTMAVSNYDVIYQTITSQQHYQFQEETDAILVKDDNDIWVKFIAKS